MEPYWNESNGHAAHPVKYESEAAVSSFPYCTESSLNFSTSATAYSEDDAEYATGRRNKTSRQDPLSHRIIEKRRRDRMNSCLADLSRLIPPQYQRKGRGRIEKTEIIEMAIRHLKHLQSECQQKESDYRSGYMDCMKEAAKFLYDVHMQDFCHRLLGRLQEHIDEMFKTDCYKSTRSCHMPDNVSASSGSPHQAYHPPLCHLRDMLATSASDVEHSQDHNDVKDLSFRNHLNQLQRSQQAAAVAAAAAAAAVAVANGSSPGSSAGLDSKVPLTNGGGNVGAAPAGDNVPSNSTANGAAAAAAGGNSNSSGSNSSNAASSTTCPPVGGACAPKITPLAAHQQPHQAPVITSTAPHHHLHHTDSSHHDFESSREPILHTDTSNMHSPPPRDLLLQQHPHLAHSHHTQDSLMSVRMRNYSESSHEVEHNNNYKYKNHIKERFVHELHDEETSSEHCPVAAHLQSDHSHLQALSEHSKDGTEPEIAPIMAKKRKLAEAAANGEIPLEVHTETGSGAANPSNRPDKPSPSFNFSDIKDIKAELHSGNSNSSPLLAKLSAAAAAGGQLSTPSSTTAPLPPRHSFTVPIFALHGQGNYYVPLNVDYNALVPFLNGMDLLEKSYTSMPVVHPININVNFMPTSPSASFLAAAAAAAVAVGKQQQQQQQQQAVVAVGSGLPLSTNSAAAQAAAVAAAAVAKAKLEQAMNQSW
ncbi:transcription factor cwo isoform X2 [Drosophila gunungcola]|uniref:transcription factor cwo isoform X2 n=1 Tax=Drosophila gunungcola TaxID=103775 RepID=UPI0022E0CAD5|nr:transcription factor cwo isoform X2 [Drosophila gunungcola]